MPPAALCDPPAMSLSSSLPTLRRPAPSRLPPTLDRLELKCNCKLTMRPRCLVGKLPGCRSRRHTKRCDCEVKLLPVCLLGEGIGCAKRQLGQRCSCRKAMMPLCFALGCDERKEGRLCDCQRTAGKPCKHVFALARRRMFFAMTPEQLDHFVRWWGNRLGHFDDYMEPLTPEPDVAVTQEDRITLMECRENLGLSLFHPQDVRSPGIGREDELLARRRVDFFRLIRKQGGSVCRS